MVFRPPSLAPRIAAVAALGTLAQCASCGRPASPDRGVHARVPPSLVATAEGSTDGVVAQVGGRPVWASCVSHQLAAADATPAPVGATGDQRRRHALDECIGFELLAQEAERRGLAADPGVMQRYATTLVSVLVARAFEARYPMVAQLPAAYVAATLPKIPHDQSHPEGRASAYVRYPVDQARFGTAVDVAAHAVMQQVADATNPRTGLFPIDLPTIANPIAVAAAPGVTLVIDGTPVSGRGGMPAAYDDAVWVIPEVGRTAGPVRTPWGWDVILLTAVVPATTVTDAEAATQAFPELRRLYFTEWVHELQSASGVPITLGADAEVLLEKLTAADRATGP